MRLYLIRHAQSENNARWVRTRAPGGYVPDPLLTELGHKQAKTLAKFLKPNSRGGLGQKKDPFDRYGFHITHLYCSLMQRAIQTGAYISQALGLPLNGREDIHERGGLTGEDDKGGEPVGLPGPGRAFFTSHYPDLVLPDTVNDAGWWNRPYETREQANRRAGQLLDNLTTHHNNLDDRVAMVTHGGFINTLLKELLGATKPDYDSGDLTGFWFGAGNASITKIEFESDLVLLVYHNRTDFMATKLIT
ncbi:MAG TPA: histidine phosphatase family protein [Patescibacteria group bacterium]|nr:histidine phosphatase family protein [Patescibacteria group bacterium]